MSKKIIKRICRLQGIEPQIEVKVLCIKCENRSLVLKPNADEAYCYRCKQSWSMEEILMLVEDKYAYYDKSDIQELKNNSTGVCG